MGPARARAVTFAPMHERLSLGRTGVDAVTEPQALARIDALASDAGGTVFTPNVDHVVRAERDPALAAAYSRARLLLCDGMPVLWAAGLFGGVPARLTGSKVLPRVLALAARRGYTVYFVGGRVGVAERLAVQLPQRFPGLPVLGCSPPTRALAAPGALAAVEAELAALRPDLVLVSLASPLQEVWADAAHARLGHGVFVCTGSAVDILAGLVPAAPALMARLGFEWLWRVVHEPRRLAGRYLAGALRFPPIVVRQWLTT
jgi:N-acetylglucosaminyldiphosphoundecaprenol N-acetyl-beta-D-mannosaminyltransferase